MPQLISLLSLKKRINPPGVALNFLVFKNKLPFLSISLTWKTIFFLLGRRVQMFQEVVAKLDNAF